MVFSLDRPTGQPRRQVFDRLVVERVDLALGCAEQLGQLRARLEFADLDELLAHLDEEMGRIQEVAAEVT